MTKQIFNAEQFNKSPAKVYRAADRDGSVIINNGQYGDRIFELISRDRRANLEDDNE